MPGAYFFAAYRARLGSLQQRANRLVKIYVIAVLGLTVLLLALVLSVNRLAIQATSLAWGIPIIILATIIALFGFAPILSLPALAGAYQRPWTDQQSHRLELRANRLFVPYLFIIVLTFALTCWFVLASYWLALPGETLLISMVAIMVSSSVALTAYRPFQQFVERSLFGLPPLPPHLVEAFTDQLAELQDRENLIHLLRDRILGAFQVRESALFYLSDAGDMTLAYTQSVDPEALAALAVMPATMQEAEAADQATQAFNRQLLPPWVHFVLPLQHSEQLLGLWFLGQRDPDDVYSHRELATLRTLANQAAVALIRFAQAEKLRALYEANIERSEQERKKLARELHDETLNQLGAMAMYMEDEQAAPEFHHLYEGIVQQLRGIIVGLRPKMLDFGLWTGLNQLVDDSMSRKLQATEILFDVPKATARYEERVEQHVYRITQQALENALRHAQAEIIRIYGTLQPNRIELTIEDNGIGFEYKESLSLARLLRQGHYGLVGMYERAELIQARLQVESISRDGTRVTLLWLRPDDAPSTTLPQAG
jgi:signal transduction histidine kinase